MTTEPKNQAPLSEEMLKKMDAYWRASNYLAAAQLYLYDNPMLKEPLTLAHIKPNVVGHVMLADRSMLSSERLHPGADSDRYRQP